MNNNGYNSFMPSKTLRRATLDKLNGMNSNNIDLFINEEKESLTSFNDEDNPKPADNSTQVIIQSIDSIYISARIC